MEANEVSKHVVAVGEFLVDLRSLEAVDADLERARVDVARACRDYLKELARLLGEG